MEYQYNFIKMSINTLPNDIIATILDNTDVNTYINAVKSSSIFYKASKYSSPVESLSYSSIDHYNELPDGLKKLSKVYVNENIKDNIHVHCLEIKEACLIFDLTKAKIDRELSINRGNFLQDIPQIKRVQFIYINNNMSIKKMSRISYKRVCLDNIINLTEIDEICDCEVVTIRTCKELTKINKIRNVKELRLDNCPKFKDIISSINVGSVTWIK